ncbi:MAG: hypothetical protein C4523_04895, partial [Myxococcales bacterium]
DVVAEPATGEALARALVARLPAGAPALVVRGAIGRKEIAAGLEAGGCRIFPLTVYANGEPPPPVVSAPFEAAVFASPSAAERFCAANPAARGAALVAIGETTAAWLCERGFAPTVSRAPTPEALAEAVIDALRNRPIDKEEA